MVTKKKSPIKKTAKKVAKKTDRKSVPRKYQRDEKSYREMLSLRENPVALQKADELNYIEYINERYDNINDKDVFHKISKIHDKRENLKKNIANYYKEVDKVLNEIVRDNHYFTSKDINTPHFKLMLKDIVDDFRREARSNAKNQRYFDNIKAYLNNWDNFENVKTGASLEDRRSRRDLIGKFGASGIVATSKSTGSFDERIIGEDIPEFEPYVGESIPHTVYRKSNGLELKIKRRGSLKGVKNGGINVKTINPKKMFSGYKIAGKR